MLPKFGATKPSLLLYCHLYLICQLSFYLCAPQKQSYWSLATFANISSNSWFSFLEAQPSLKRERDVQLFTPRWFVHICKVQKTFAIIAALFVRCGKIWSYFMWPKQSGDAQLLWRTGLSVFNQVASCLCAASRSETNGSKGLLQASFKCSVETLLARGSTQSFYIPFDSWCLDLLSHQIWFIFHESLLHVPKLPPPPEILNPTFCA